VTKIGVGAKKKIKKRNVKSDQNVFGARKKNRKKKH
tara:strand:+ start:74 stop:181 length:108 start_codon:yes stop_codon:yes gene_type:complete